MGSTVIINQTSKPLDMKIGNYRSFTNFATVDKNSSYTLHVGYNDTYLEYSLGADTTGNSVIVSSDECVDNKTITIKEVNGKFNVEWEPRRRSSNTTYTSPTPGKNDSTKKRSKRIFW